MESGAETYHFKIDGGDPIGGVLEAIAFVKARGVMEIEPLGRRVDPDALEDVVRDANGVAVSFRIEGLTVEVTSAGDIYIEDPTPESFIHESIGGASNVLLDCECQDDEACVDLLSVEPYEDERLLGVLHASSYESRVSSWDRYMGEPPAQTAAINVGDFPRSATARAGGDQTGKHRDPVSFVPDASDLAALEAAITERLDRLDDPESQLVVCFDSIAGLLRDAPAERSMEFLRSMRAEMADRDAVAHYHFDPDSFDASTESAIRTLFERCVTIEGDGDWRVR